jgi:hypothetical protein
MARRHAAEPRRQCLAALPRVLPQAGWQFAGSLSMSGCRHPLCLPRSKSSPWMWKSKWMRRSRCWHCLIRSSQSSQNSLSQKMQFGPNHFPRRDWWTDDCLPCSASPALTAGPLVDGQVRAGIFELLGSGRTPIARFPGCDGPRHPNGPSPSAPNFCVPPGPHRARRTAPTATSALIRRAVLACGLFPCRLVSPSCHPSHNTPCRKNAGLPVPWRGTTPALNRTSIDADTIGQLQGGNTFSTMNELLWAPNC